MVGDWKLFPHTLMDSRQASSAHWLALLTSITLMQDRDFEYATAHLLFSPLCICTIFASVAGAEGFDGIQMR